MKEEFNLTRSIGELAGKLLRASYLSVRHPVSFTPKNINQLFTNVTTGLKNGWKHYDNKITIVQATKANFDESEVRDPVGTS